MTEQALDAAEEALRRDDLNGAEAALTRAWPDAQQMPSDGLHLLGDVRARQQRFADAEKQYRAAVAAAPDALRHHIALGNALAAVQNHAGAADAYANALRIDMNWPGLMQVYALSCYRADRYEEAEKAARRWLKDSPSPEAWDALSCTLRALGKHQEALAAADEALRLNPSSAPAQHSRGAALLQLGRSQEALDIFERLAMSGVQAPVIWLSRGNALASLERQSEALAAYSEGARRWPNDRDLQKALAEARR